MAQTLKEIREHFRRISNPPNHIRESLRMTVDPTGVYYDEDGNIISSEQELDRRVEAEIEKRNLLGKGIPKEDYHDSIDGVLTKYPPKSTPVICGHAIDLDPNGEQQSEADKKE